MLDSLTSLSENICLSGGAKGSDLQWGMMAGRLGHQVIHWSFSGHRTQAPEVEVSRLTEEQLAVADDVLKRANKSLKRSLPFHKTWLINLLRRNYYQVAWTQAVYGVGEMDHNMEVKGGTAWATQMYMDRFIHDGEPLEDCKLYFYNQTAEVWLQWKGKWEILIGEPPQPSGVWTGIGSRELKVSGKWAIRNLMGGYPVGDEQILSLIPPVEELKEGDKIYVPGNKIPGKGLDNRVGGLATVQRIQKSVDDIYFSVIEYSGVDLSWSVVKPMQDSLRQEFKLSPAHLKPNDSRENNYLTEEYRIR